MHRTLVWVGLAAAVTSVVFGQVPATELATPPANARHFVIQSTGGKHGDSWMWVAADGTRMGRESRNLRGQVFELDSTGKAGADGLPAQISIRGTTMGAMNGDPTPFPTDLFVQRDRRILATSRW